ncbi:MAG: 30S ribosomal protein S20 [Bacteroidota bacterium]|nr:30S ribosomal protein S20 [Bacteroidota bacterium]
MANHKSSKKRIRNNATKRLRNRYQAKSTRTLAKRIRTSTVKSEAETLLREVSSMLDKLAKRSIIHKNKASNQKSKLAKVVAKVGMEKVIVKRSIKKKQTSK